MRKKKQIFGIVTAALIMTTMFTSTVGLSVKAATDSSETSSTAENLTVITSYSIHYTKLYDMQNKQLGFCLRDLIPPAVMFSYELEFCLCFYILVFE